MDGNRITIRILGITRDSESLFSLAFFFFDHYFRSSLRLILHRLANEPQLAECSAGRVMFSGGNQTSEHTVGDNQPQTQCQKV